MTTDEARAAICRALGSLPDEIAGTVETGMQVRIPLARAGYDTLRLVGEALATPHLMLVCEESWDQVDCECVCTVHVRWPGGTDPARALRLF